MYYSRTGIPPMWAEVERCAPGGSIWSGKKTKGQGGKTEIEINNGPSNIIKTTKGRVIAFAK